MTSEECAIYRSSHNLNIILFYFLVKNNPHFYEEIENNQPHVMIWAKMTVTHLLGLYFFDNQDSYLQMMIEWSFPELRNNENT